MKPSSRFVPSEVESRWTEAWRVAGVGHADPDGDAPGYSIAIPPPNVTGALHIGHALNNTIQDLLIRSRRMAGDETMWICGTDHAGIATQAVVEKALAAEGLSRKELGREEFVRRVWEWRDHSGGTIIGQLRRLGCTLDYERERFTMDEAYADAVLHVFVDLYEKGHIYRDRYMVNWDPGLGSAISDLEVEEREVEDTLVSIAYPLSDGSGEVVVATVRPETMLGDTAVAVNPSDERYRDLIGRTVTLPLVGREIPIVGDDYVQVDFGTGALKVTPAHDANDFEIGRRHDLEAINVIGEDGRMTEAAGEAYAGLTPAACQAAVVEDLRALGLLRGVEPYTHTVPFSQRSGARVEPLVSLQWFCDMTRLAQPAIAAVEEGRVRFTPAKWGEVYLDWMREIRPWCVSRQLWWGHQLPVYYRTTTPRARSLPAVTGHRRTCTSAGRRPRARAGCATRTSSTPGSARPCGRSPRSDGPADPRAREVLPHRGALDGPRHHLPVGRAHGDDGTGVHRARSRSPTSTSTRWCRRPTAGG